MMRLETEAWWKWCVVGCIMMIRMVKEGSLGRMILDNGFGSFCDGRLFFSVLVSKLDTIVSSPRSHLS